MDEIPKEWFSVQTVREVGGFVLLGVFCGVYGLAMAIRREWVSLSSSVKTSVELAVANEKIRHKDKEITRLKAEISELTEVSDA